MSSFSDWYDEEHDQDAIKRGRIIHRFMEKVMQGNLSVSYLNGRINGYDELEFKLRDYRYCYRTFGGGVEQKLGVDEQWSKCFWRRDGYFYDGRIDLWYRNHKEHEHVTLVEWKSGHFKDLDMHSEQVRLYSTLLFAHQSDVYTISSDIVYLDLGEIHHVDSYVHTWDLDYTRRLWENRKWGSKHFG